MGGTNRCQKCSLDKGKSVLTFDRVVPTGTSMFYALRLVPRGTQESGAVAVASTTNSEIKGTNGSESPGMNTTSRPVAVANELTSKKRTQEIT